MKTYPIKTQKRVNRIQKFREQPYRPTVFVDSSLPPINPFLRRLTGRNGTFAFDCRTHFAWRDQKGNVVIFEKDERSQKTVNNRLYSCYGVRGYEVKKEIEKPGEPTLGYNPSLSTVIQRNKPVT